MNRIRRFVIMLAGLAGAVLAFSAAATPAFATLVPPPVQVHTIVTGGMPGWQITLIAAGAALLATVLAVTADRMRAGRRMAATTA